MIKIRDSFVPSYKLPDKLLSYDEVIEAKNRLYREIKSESIKKVRYPVTHLGKCIENWYNQEVVYMYSRQGIFSENALKTLYGFDIKEEDDVRAHLTKSCQAANWSVLYSLVRAYNTNFDVNRDLVFYETLEILKLIGVAQNDLDGVKVNYIDSSSKDYALPESVEENEIVVIDTTNLYRGNINLERFVQSAIKEKWKIILTRSHLKLDSLGCEYGMLGSITIISQDEFPKRKLKFKQIATVNFYKYVQGVLSAHSYYANIEDVYPFFNTQSLDELYDSRFKRLINNYKALSDELNENSIIFDIFEHKVFLTLTTDIDADKIEQFLFDKNLYLTKIRKKTNIPIYLTDSFGFDFFSVTAYSGIRKAGVDKLIVRISMGDMDENDFSKIVKNFSSIAKQLITY